MKMFDRERYFVKNRRHKNWIILFIITICLAALAYFAFIVRENGIFLISRSVKNNMSDTLGIDVREGTEIAYNDSHGGFHGDGLTFAAISFSDNAVSKALSNNKNWHPMPLSGELSILVYGIETEHSRNGPYLTDEDGKAIIPDIQNGYYYFIDRYNQNDTKKSDSGLLDRYSYNFTIAIYDTDSDILYYAEYDT